MQAWQAGLQAGQKAKTLLDHYNNVPQVTPAPNFGATFLNNLGQGAEKMFMPTLSAPTQMIGGAGDSLINSAKKMYQGAKDVATMNQPPTIGGRLGQGIGGIGKMASEAMYAPAGAVISGLTSSDLTKPVGQALGAIPVYLEDQARKLYGTPTQQGAFGQAAQALNVPGAQNMSDFMAYGGKDVATQAANVLYAKVLGDVAKYGLKGARAMYQDWKAAQTIGTPEKAFVPTPESVTGNNNIALENQLQDLRSQFEKTPTPELSNQITSLENRIQSLQEPQIINEKLQQPLTEEELIGIWKQAQRLLSKKK